MPVDYLNMGVGILIGFALTTCLFIGRAIDQGEKIAKLKILLKAKKERK